MIILNEKELSSVACYMQHQSRFEYEAARNAMQDADTELAVGYQIVAAHTSRRARNNLLRIIDQKAGA